MSHTPTSDLEKASVDRDVGVHVQGELRRSFQPRRGEFGVDGMGILLGPSSLDGLELEMGETMSFILIGG